MCPCEQTTGVHGDRDDALRSMMTNRDRGKFTARPPAAVTDKVWGVKNFC